MEDFFRYFEKSNHNAAGNGTDTKITNYALLLLVKKHCKYFLKIATINSCFNFIGVFSQTFQIIFSDFTELNHVIDYNHFHNILRLFNDLTNFCFTTSETMRDYYL